jgi:rhombotail lipoprotein
MKATQNKKRVLRFGTLVLVLAVVVAGCATVNTQRRASVVSYLYPKSAGPVERPTVPLLALPLDVGIAFVPEDGASPYYQAQFTESDKLTLMNEIANHFRKCPFVRCIELIPTQYLTAGGGFENLEQINTMFGTEVITLLSYDQNQFTDQGLLSVSYWTLVGAYVVRGERNDTVTMIDAAVYHVPSRKMLFRAPGTSRIRHSSTPVNLSEQLRRDSGTGFKLAATNLTANLQTQLELFQEKVRNSPEEYTVIHKPGYTGIGKMDAGVLLLLIVIGGILVCPRPHGKP